MNNPSIPDRAALLMQAEDETKREINRLKALDGNWSELHMLAEESMRIARDGLVNAASMLYRIRQIADEQAHAITTAKEKANG